MTVFPYWSDSKAEAEWKYTSVIQQIIPSIEQRLILTVSLPLCVFLEADGYLQRPRY
jgi:hypothetical protein